MRASCGVPAVAPSPGSSSGGSHGTRDNERPPEGNDLHAQRPQGRERRGEDLAGLPAQARGRPGQQPVPSGAVAPQRRARRAVPAPDGARRLPRAQGLADRRPSSPIRGDRTHGRRSPRSLTDQRRAAAAARGRPRRARRTEDWARSSSRGRSNRSPSAPSRRPSRPARARPARVGRAGGCAPLRAGTYSPSTKRSSAGTTRLARARASSSRPCPSEPG